MPNWTWPPDDIGWAMFVSLFLLGFFKIRRGYLMHHRATFFDRLGLSAISFDYVVGAAYIISAILSVQPTWRTPHVRLALLIPVAAIAAWAWIEMEIAPTHRIERVVSSGTGKDIGAPGDPDFPILPYDGPERRILPWGRRHTDQRGL